MSSFFALPLQRSSAVTFFLGSIVPLAALSALVHAGASVQIGGFIVSWPALQLSAAMLSMGAFFALRRSVRGSVAESERTAARLRKDAKLHAKRVKQLSERTRALSSQSDEVEIAVTAAAAACELVDGVASMVLWRTSECSSLKPLGVSGQTELFSDGARMSQLRCATLSSLAAGETLRSKEGMTGPDGKDWMLPSGIFIPMHGREGSGGLVLMEPAGASGSTATELDSLEMLAAVAACRLASAERESAAVC